MTTKTWTRLFLATAIAGMAIVFLFNRLGDTRWSTSGPSLFGDKMPVFDERRQKTNFLVHGKPTFSNLILGSSRTSYISTNRIPGGMWFNYSCSGMYPEEFLGFTHIASQYAVNKKLDTVLIGLDFWTTRKSAIVDYGNPIDFLKEAKSLKTTTNWLTLDALTESIKTIRLNTSGSESVLENEAYYTWTHLEKNRTPMRSATRDTKIKEQLWYYEKDVFGQGYHYDSDCLAPIRALIAQYPNTVFILFNTPVHPKLEALKQKFGREEAERKWLKEIENMGAHWHHPNKNDFTDTMFFDTHHLKPWHYNRLVSTIINGE